ncbi:cation:proton antiporter [Paenibacillus melissococcoides]|uniref:Cation:proton antiporter n=1 Tax=Paenibacillus melissococcoides TaxID=2912268 RepID=A0ABN8UCH6_9BACL|nr:MULTISPECIES: cation:proton antiporter [Paenibacillus]MEB9896228.1 cation:proton antiporter [Bacillus cereus]GIO79815.1 sodium:proton antiporter [Paenibacillus dendritiformis]CAH8247162.1 cation:proton antiporter [Paenibacillus melissococcoides]CAH8717881.1 cation:proton antiporter [Paenibacillus melissococcoides]
MEFILYLALILLCTKVAGDISVRLGQPAVLGKLIVGILLGPAVLGWIEKDSFITQVSEIGVLLLMFIAGLETDVDQLRKNWKSAFAVAVGGIILPFIGGYSSAIAFGFSSNYALFFGVIFCATSVSISVQVLKEMNKLNSREGTTILGAAVVDDVLVVILLAFIMSIVGQGGDVSIGLLVGKKLLFFAITFVAGWLIVPRVMKWLAPLKVTEAVISAALIICFAFSYFAEWMQMAGIIGAFAAGIAVSMTPYKHDVEHKVEPIAYSIFVPVFFVSIGLNVSFDGIGSQLGLLAVITIIAVVTKLAGGWLGARATGFDSRSSLAIGAGMISRGEVALIIAATGLQSGLLQPEYFTSIIIMVIITTLVTPPMLKMLFNKKDNALPVEQKNSVNM